MATTRERPITTASVVSVTSAPAHRRDDQDARIKRYLITMAIRTICFFLLVVVDSWWRWLFLAGAAFLPYFAVVLANARAPRVSGMVGAVIPRPDDLRHVGS
ncbi:MAG TPA: DUF3099 domain-containing protein [Phycicoccus sp.]|nr:DUF3099 domain-containing protein [Phycicoccus sp.]